MTTLSPRAARSIASVRPTGPAPMIATSASTASVLMVGSRCAALAASVELGPGTLDHVGPFDRLARDEAAELGRRRRTELDPGGARAGDHLGIGEHCAHLGLKLRDDGGRRRRWRDDAEPAGRLVALDARL